MVYPPTINLEHIKSAVKGNTKIIENCQNWLELYFLESHHIKFDITKTEPRH